MTRAAQRRYDAKRPPPLSLRLTEAELRALDARRHPGEGRSTAIIRLAGLRSKPCTS